MSTPAESVEASEEPLRVVEFAPTDALLREDVKMIGALVGDILAEQRGPQFLAQVERLRRAAIRRRERNAPVSELADALAGTELEHASDLVRAFTTYFQAVNVAERVHRIRRRRDYQRAEVMVAPALQTEGKQLQRSQSVGMGSNGRAAVAAGVAVSDD